MMTPKQVLVSCKQVLTSLAKRLVLDRWQTPTPIRRPALHGEELESRVVPATFLWHPWMPREYNPGNPANVFWEIVNPAEKQEWLWTDYRNWLELDEGRWVQSAEVPGDDPQRLDDVRFLGEEKLPTTFGAKVIAGNYQCVLDTPRTVNSVRIDNGYTSAITLSSTLTIAGGAVTSVLAMKSPATIIGGGTLQLAGKSVFSWQAGVLHLYGNPRDHGVQVGPQARMNIVQGTYAGGDRPTLAETYINVLGTLDWMSGSVGTSSPSLVEVVGKFNITAAGETFGNANPDFLSIKNFGTVTLNSTGKATLSANYATTGTTELQAGTLAISGTAEQDMVWLDSPSQFKLLNGTTVKTNFLGIRDGYIIGNGTVDGNLIMGFDPADTLRYRLSVPTIDPGDDTNPLGTIHVTQHFHMFNGHMKIDVAGWEMDANGRFPYDRIIAAGKMIFTNSDPASVRWVESVLLKNHAAIPTEAKKIRFLGYFDTRTDDFTFRSTVSLDPNVPGGWGTYGKDEGGTPNIYWVEIAGVAQRKGPIKGLVWRDSGAAAGVFEPGEDLLEGVTVRLFDETGTTQISSTTTDTYGKYAFTGLDAGNYVIQFDRPDDDERFAIPNATTDDLDSDADPTYGRVSVALYEDQEDVDAGLYLDTAPIAVDDSFKAHKNTATAGNVLPNDSDDDGDELTVTIASNPSHGSLVLNSDGSFTYTPDLNYYGTDTFTYTADDGYEGTATATVTITVANTPAPVGVNDSYTLDGGDLLVEAADGVLDNDTDADGDTLTASELCQLAA